MATAWDHIPLTTAALLAHHQGRTESSFLTEHHAKDPWDYPPPPRAIMNKTDFTPGGVRAAALLPNEIKYQILVDLSRIDPSCAFDVMMTCRRMARFVHKDPYSGLKQIVRFGPNECPDLVRALEDIRKGRLDPLSVRGLFHVRPIGDHLAQYSIKYRGEVIDADDLSSKLYDACPNFNAQHFWSNSKREQPSAHRYSVVTDPSTSKGSRQAALCRHVLRPIIGAPSGRDGSFQIVSLHEEPIVRFSRPSGWTSLIDSEKVWYQILVDSPRAKRHRVDFRTFIVELSPRVTWENLVNMARLVENVALRIRREEGPQAKPPFFVVFIHHLLGNCRKGYEWTEKEALKQCVRQVSGKPSWWSASDLQQITIEDAINLPSPHSISPHGTSQNVLLWNAAFGDDSMGHEPGWEGEARGRGRLLETESLPWPDIDEWDEGYWPSRPATPAAATPKKAKKHADDGDEWDSEAESEGDEEECDEDEDEELDSAGEEYYAQLYNGAYGRETPSEDEPWWTPPPKVQVWKEEQETTPPWGKLRDGNAPASKRKPDPPKAPKSTKPFTPEAAAAAAAAAASSSSSKLKDKKAAPQQAPQPQRPSLPRKTKEPTAATTKPKAATSAQSQPQAQQTPAKRTAADGSAQRASSSSGNDKKRAKKDDKGQAVWVNGELQYLSPQGPRLGDRGPRRTPPRDSSW